MVYCAGAPFFMVWAIILVRVQFFCLDVKAVSIILAKMRYDHVGHQGVLRELF